MSKESKILIVDDEPRLCDSLKTLLCSQNHEVKTLKPAEKGRERIDNFYDLYILSNDKKLVFRIEGYDL